MSQLFAGENTDCDRQLRINMYYAQKYNSWRQKEEFNKLKTKYGGTVSDTDSSSNSLSGSSEGEDDQTELKEQFDKEFYKTLAYLKNKDPKIYEKNISFFEDTNKAQNIKSEKKKCGDKKEKMKPVFLRDYERQILLQNGGNFNDNEEGQSQNSKQKDKLTYVEEQQHLKDSFKSALTDDNDDVENEDFLKPKSKTEIEKQQEEANYKEWLKGNCSQIDNSEAKDLKPLRDFWNNPNLDENEKFLRDYILNNKYLDKNQTNGHLNYEQVIHDSDDNLSEDEKNIEKQEEFEHKYNFRFEEPDREFIKRFPRTMENSMRKKDTRRSEKRAEVKQRKEDEKLRKKEELMQLKALKRKEIEEKIEKLKEITGNDDMAFNEIDLDGDFDPAEHDKKMTEIFNNDFYAAAEGDIKPEFPELDEELDIEPNWDTFDPAQDIVKEPHCEDADFNMDADYDGTQAERPLRESGNQRKRRKRTKFAELIAKDKPKFDPEQYKSYEEYFDKYYSLNYEDMIGDLPCRFKYRKVVPNDYGLTVEEILAADDKELNKWCSLKKALQHKPKHVEQNEVKTYRQKAKNEALKRRILRSLYIPETEEEGSPKINTEAEEELQSKKTRRRRKTQSQEAVEIVQKVTASKKAKKRKAEVKEALQEKRQKSENSRKKKELPAKVKSKKQTGKKQTVKTAGKTSPKDGESKQKSKKKNTAKSNGNVTVDKDSLDLDTQRLKRFGISGKKLKKKLKSAKKN